LVCGFEGFFFLVVFSSFIKAVFRGNGNWRVGRGSLTRAPAVDRTTSRSTWWTTGSLSAVCLQFPDRKVTTSRGRSPPSPSSRWAGEKNLPSIVASGETGRGPEAAHRTHAKSWVFRDVVRRHPVVGGVYRCSRSLEFVDQCRRFRPTTLRRRRGARESWMGATGGEGSLGGTCQTPVAGRRCRRIPVGRISVATLGCRDGTRLAGMFCVCSSQATNSEGQGADEPPSRSRAAGRRIVTRPG